MPKSLASGDQRAIPHSSQRPIEAHGIIGDMRTAALVADDGTVDFFCWPEFDSPSVFLSLLDEPRAGAFELAPELPGARRQQFYLPDSNVLQTRWLHNDAIVELTDFMPVGDVEGRPKLVRCVQVISGKARVTARCAVRHDYARAKTRATFHDESVDFNAKGQLGLRLSCTQSLRIVKNEARTSFVMKQGESAYFVLGCVDDENTDAAAAAALLAETQDYWRDWIRQSTYRGRWRDMVERSALALKLLTSRKHGAVLAAATFGLPESRGGERNWDYRYTWIRDASFTMYAFMRLGLTQEARQFMHWIHERLGNDSKQPQDLHIVYRIGGGTDLPEESLTHLSGYAGSTPVRIGNLASEQLQLDIYGELMDGVYLYNKYGGATSHAGWQHVVRMVDHVGQNWNKPDVGIWEMRGSPRHYLHSRLMSWVAVDRAIRLARKRSLSAPLEQWYATRDAINADIWDNFYDEERGHFVQHLGSGEVDGSLLMMPLVRFVGGSDPRWLSTLAAIERDLVRDGMVYRYRSKPGERDQPDPLQGKEGAFAACSFWYVECLARAGRVTQARMEFEKLLRYANRLGLYAEQFDRQGRHLGNTPQALTHLALISAATFLDRSVAGEQTMWRS